MRTHIEYSPLKQTVDIYVEDRPGSWLKLVDHNTVQSVQVDEGVEPPPFLTLPDYIWSAIIDQVPGQVEDFTLATLRREQERVDKFIDDVLGRS